MKFEWDETKSRANKSKHGIDFATARSLWLDDARIEIEAPYEHELRKLLLATLKGKQWTAVFTERSGAIRIISVRRSRKDEEEYYEKEKFR